MLAPTDLPHLRELASRRDPAWLREDLEDGSLPESRHLLQGTNGYSAIVETEPGSAGSDEALATSLSEELGGVVYSIGVAGYDDPDHGVPYIARYERGARGLIWMDTEGEEIETVSGPEGVPLDPLAFARAFGVELDDRERPRRSAR